MKKATFFIFFAMGLALSLAGCLGVLTTWDVVTARSMEKKAESAEEISVVFSPAENSSERYSFFYQDDKYTLSLYEPDQGCYLAVFPDAKRYTDMREYDKAVQSEHAVFSCDITLGEELPQQWVLGCIASMKTPNIFLLPPESNPFDLNTLNETAETFGQFNIPMFVHLYPEPSDYNYNPREYINFYRRAREIFKEKATNAAFVWTVGADDVWDTELYYPGDEYTDWVGISIEESIGTDGVYDERSGKKLDYFYQIFQKRKPIMISRLAISHYSDANHVYYIREAAAEIERMYKLIINQYPRIKLVSYMDHGGYAISDNERILEAYIKAVSGDMYLNILDSRETSGRSAQLYKSPFAAYKQQSRYYISEKTLSAEMNIKNLGAAKIIEGERYFDLAILKNSSIYSVETDDENKRLLVRK